VKRLRRFAVRAAAPFTRRRDDARLAEELEQHITLLADDYVRAGHTPAAARRLARLKLGPLEEI
jgi:hypothetical protein